jgi:general secretion pathway protein G
MPRNPQPRRSLFASQKLTSRKRTRRAAFTLMEVLLVLAILVILGGMVGVMYQNVQGNANNRAARAQIDLLVNAVKLYQLNAQQLPGSLDDLMINPGMDTATWGGPYIEKKPVDPWGNEYTYSADQNTGKVTITSMGKDKQANTSDDITSG